MAVFGLVSGSTAAIAQKPSGSATQPSATAKKLVQTTAAATPKLVAKPAPVDQDKAIRRVHLAIDGNLPGRTIRIDTRERPVPVKAKVWFLQNGQVVNEVRTDDDGRFQMIGLKPGNFSVIAAGRGAAGAVTVEVLPYQPKLAKELTVLIIELGEPPREGEPSEERVGGVPFTGEMAGAMAGPGAVAGGGGGLLGLAGLAAGLGGLAAGLGGGGGGGPASPVVP
jgi:hypothetical protein